MEKIDFVVALKVTEIYGKGKWAIICNRDGNKVKGRKEKIKRRIKRGKEKGGERKYEVRELNSTQFEYLNFRSNLSISYHSH